MSRMHRDQGQLIELIFDCAESPDGLQPALAEIADLLDAKAGHSLVLHQGALTESHFHADIDPTAFETYERDWQDKDPRFGAAIRSPGRVFSDIEVLPPAEFEASDIYNDFLSRHEIRYTLFTNTDITPDLLLAQSFLRSRKAGPFEQEQIRQLNALLPHLKRALHLRHLVGGLRNEVQDLRRALEAIPGAVAILAADGRLICANAAAARLFTLKDGIGLERQRVSALHPGESQRLAAAIKQAAGFGEGASARARRVPYDPPIPVKLTRADKQPLGVVLSPLRPANPLRLSGDRNARVLALFHDPEEKLRLNPALIAQLHGLTETEALLASALAQGQTLADFAAERGSSEQTARTHMKRVLEKTGTHRQSDLVRVLLGSAALHLANG